MINFMPFLDYLKDGEDLKMIFNSLAIWYGPGNVFYDLTLNYIFDSNTGRIHYKKCATKGI